MGARLVAPSNVSSNTSGLSIMESEIISAFSALKKRKAPGEKNIHGELLKLMNTKKLCQLFNAIYDSGSISAN